MQKLTAPMDAVITSLPDAEEVANVMTRDAWASWFIRAASLVLERTQTYCIFVQTDRKVAGGTIDKSHLINKAAEQVSARLVWHKIALRREPGKIDLYRPTFTHLQCFSKDSRLKRGKETPDVIMAGSLQHKNGIGRNAVAFCAAFIKENCNAQRVFDPFCGHGTMLSVSRELGFAVIGVDIDEACCLSSRQLLGLSN